MRIPAILLAITMASTAANADSDPWGNVYPPQCADLSGINLPVITVSKLPLQFGTASRCGAWLDRAEGHLILLLTPEKCHTATRAETLRHELCHEAMWRATGSAYWHGSKP
jgi:hypothetical protein